MPKRRVVFSFSLTRVAFLLHPSLSFPPQMTSVTEDKTQDKSTESKAPANRLYLHPDGWLRPQPTAVAVDFEHAESPTAPDVPCDDPSPLYAALRKFNGVWGPCGIPVPHDTPWAGSAPFLFTIQAIQEHSAEVFSVEPAQTIDCRLCKAKLVVGRRYAYEFHHWDSSYLHYLRDHWVMPTADLYNCLRDADDAKLRDKAVSFYHAECAEVRAELFRLAMVKAIEELKMTHADMQGKVRPMFPPPFAFRGRGDLCKIIAAENAGIKETIADPKKWAELKLEVKLSDEARNKILSIRKHGFTEIEAMLKRQRERVAAKQ